MMSAVAQATANLDLATEDHKKKLEQQQQSSNSLLVRQLARVQQESQKHNLSPTDPSRISMEQIQSQRQQAAQKFQTEFLLNNSDASISTSSTPSVSILPSFLLSQNPFADNSSLGSLSSAGSPIQRPMR